MVDDGEHLERTGKGERLGAPEVSATECGPDFPDFVVMESAGTTDASPFDGPAPAPSGRDPARSTLVAPPGRGWDGA